MAPIGVPTFHLLPGHWNPAEIGGYGRHGGVGGVGNETMISSRDILG